MKNSARLLLTSLSLLILMLGGLVWLSTATFAQSSLTLTAIPPRLGDDLSLKGKPGEKLQTSIRVRNASDQPVQVQSLAQDFVIGEDGETPVAVTEEVSNRWSLAKWVTLTPNVQTLQPNEAGTINVLIEIPSDALPGGHYAMVTHQPMTGSANEIAPTTGAGSSLNQRVGTLLYVVVDGPINEEAFIRNFSLPTFSEYGPVPFSFSVDNQSDIHITPQIGIEIYNIFGQKVDTIVVESKNIFPLLSRDFEGKWERIWGIGPYTAKAVMSYGTQGQIVVAKTTFWLFPLSLVLAGLVVLMVFLVISIAVRRHLDHRNDSNRQKVEMLEQRLAEMERDRINDLERRQP
ncbi:MAG TPA: hypothetical protein VF209_02455 [Patescibacteria group bacterium]